jgi:hypothetical protein
MIDYRELMTILSVPRPNGSAAEETTRRALTGWLERRGIPYQVQSFKNYPFFFECLGLWLIPSRSLLALAVWLRWGWLSVPIALLGSIGGTLDYAFNWPLVTWVGSRLGENILVQFGPPNANREVVFCAHYDTKTELLDHRQRTFFLKALPWGIALILLLGALGPLERWLTLGGSYWSDLAYWSGVTLTVPLLFLAWRLGLNLSLGRLLEPSQGAVDDGAACSVLLGLVARLTQGEIALQGTRVILALFGGEEVNMQGSRAYARGRKWSLPSVVVNLEVMAQDGDYVYWEQDGNALCLLPTSQRLNRELCKAVQAVTGSVALPAGPVLSDGGSFLAVGISATTLGTYDSRLKDTGFHRPTDNLGRVVMARLPQGVEILAEFLRRYGSASHAS